jgi:hypothetical protein
LLEAVNAPLNPLSRRAASGFLSRAERGNLRFSTGFLEDVRRHIALAGEAAA